MGFRKAKYTPEQIKEIKKVVKENDITDGYSLKSEVDLPPEKADVFSRTKKMFAQYWKNNLKDLGINKSMKNFSIDHPVNFLMNTDSNIIGEIVSEASDIFDGNTDYSEINYNDFLSILTENVEDEKAAAILQLYKNTIDAELNRFAKNAGKDVSELTNEEIRIVYDTVFEAADLQVINALMVGQQVPELYDVSRKNAVIEDFNENQKENHPKIDFERKLYGLRRKFDCIFSFEELAESDLVGLSPEDEAFEISELDFDKMLVGFINTLDETDRMICYMKMDGKTQHEIAQALGYKNHSAVTKRMAKIKEKIPSYIEKLNI